MNQPASDVYEIVLEDTGTPQNWFRAALTAVLGALSTGERSANPGSAIISVRHKQSGEELFRHIEEMGDDEDHLLQGITNDLATMSAQEFATTWAS